MIHINRTAKICLAALMLSAINVKSVADNFDYFDECLFSEDSDGDGKVVPFDSLIALSPGPLNTKRVTPSTVGDSVSMHKLVLSATRKTGSENEKSKFKELVKANIGLNFETSSEDSRAAISYERASTSNTSSLQLLNISLSAPVAKSGDTTISRLGSFSSDAQVKISMSKFTNIWKYNKMPKNHKATLRAKVLKGMQAKKEDKCDGDTACERKVDLLDRKKIKINPSCLEEHIGASAADKFDEYSPIASSFIGGSVAVGYKSFDFTDPADSSDQTKDKTPWSAEAFVGRYSADRKRIYRAGYKYVKDYEAEDEVLICQAPEMDGTQKCENKRFAGPKDDNQNVVFIETRQLLDKSFLKAVTAKLSFDFEDDELELDLPLYLYSDAESNLNGGIRLGWKQDKAAGKSDDFIFGVFVGSTFEVSR